jgi:hypothetical protein
LRSAPPCMQPCGPQAAQHPAPCGFRLQDASAAGSRPRRRNNSQVPTKRSPATTAMAIQIVVEETPDEAVPAADPPPIEFDAASSRSCAICAACCCAVDWLAAVAAVVSDAAAPDPTTSIADAAWRVTPSTARVRSTMPTRSVRRLLTFAFTCLTSGRRCCPHFRPTSSSTDGSPASPATPIVQWWPPEYRP